MKYEDLKMMYEVISEIESMLNYYLDTLEESEWVNFYELLEPHQIRFGWVLDTLDSELRDCDFNYDSHDPGLI